MLRLRDADDPMIWFGESPAASETPPIYDRASESFCRSIESRAFRNMAGMVFLRPRLVAGFIAMAIFGGLAWSAAKEARAADDPCDALTGTTIRWIVPFSPGGGYDTSSRILEPFLERRLGAEIVVSNVTGAGGIIGAKHLKRAKPDGRTLALLHASSLIIAELLGTEDSPRLAEEFTILGLFGREPEIWLASAASNIRSMDDLFTKASQANVIYGSAAFASETWLTGSMGSDILAIEVDFVAGYKGSKERLLSLLRGELDVTSNSWSSSRAFVESGDLRPLAQISSVPIADHPALDGVPVLGGPDGVAVRRARALGRDPQVARAQAEGLANIIGAGRIIAAPKGLDPGLASCLEDALHAATTDARFESAMAKAKLPVDAIRGTEASKSIRAAMRDVKPFIGVAVE